MRAVWTAARAAVRRRRLQTLVIALVTLTSSAALVVALGLLDAASAPFDRAFARERGPHVVAAFDPAKVSDDRLKRAAGQPGVEAVAGPFPQAGVELPSRAMEFGLGGEITVIGRAGPGGPVDRLDVWAGRWATRPGEIVIHRQADWFPDDLGKKIRIPSGPTLTVVGFASGLSRTADAWVAPEQIGALRPTTTQMLFRFDDASSETRLRDRLATVTDALPADALTASRSYLTLKDQVSSSARAYTPYLMAFGVLGVAVAVLIIANVVSGAVISGFRHIGVLKALGFTPGQVVAVYLAMISLPAITGCLLGTTLGNLLSRPFFEFVFSGPDAGVFHGAVSVPVWVNAVTLLGMPAVCLLAALAPAVRAHRMPAARAISAGSAPRAGRALGIQRRLAGSRLPRSLSLGAGLPFARPGRSALTLAAVVLGVTTVTFATGLATTVDRFGTAGRDAYQVTVYMGNFKGGKEIEGPALDDPELRAMLAALPGASEVTARAGIEARMTGSANRVMLEARRGDRLRLDSVLSSGRWTRGAGEMVAGSAFLRHNGVEVGDTVRLEKGDRAEKVRIVGEYMASDARMVVVHWSTFTRLAPREKPIAYHVKLRDGADPAAYVRAAAAADPGLNPVAQGPNSVTRTIIGSATALTLMLALVSGLGVFNTVVLNTRDRRRDLGTLKSLGMTPRQVTAMTVTSMAVLGALGSVLGVPLGILGYELVVPRMAEAVDITLPAYMTDVWQATALTGLACTGLAIAVLGALVPARRAARLTIAEVLRSE
ncbi:FtsX-like permease family protein [Streptomyces sp. enrichment culture]|uniref:ABC transporter permease n=1 Tax=Streptomyces sp. enrichment culture TaxID=1795815 RepID=UPI003F55158B